MGSTSNPKPGAAINKKKETTTKDDDNNSSRSAPGRARTSNNSNSNSNNNNNNNYKPSRTRRKKRPNIALLPFEIVVHNIFPFFTAREILSRVCFVCKAWQNAIATEEDCKMERKRQIRIRMANNNNNNNNNTYDVVVVHQHQNNRQSPASSSSSSSSSSLSDLKYVIRFNPFEKKYAPPHWSVVLPSRKYFEKRFELEWRYDVDLTGLYFTPIPLPEEELLNAPEGIAPYAYEVNECTVGSNKEWSPFRTKNGRRVIKRTRAGAPFACYETCISVPISDHFSTTAAAARRRGPVLLWEVSLFLEFHEDRVSLSGHPRGLALQVFPSTDECTSDRSLPYFEFSFPKGSDDTIWSAKGDSEFRFYLSYGRSRRSGKVTAALPTIVRVHYKAKGKLGEVAGGISIVDTWVFNEEVKQFQRHEESKQDKNKNNNNNNKKKRQ